MVTESLEQAVLAKESSQPHSSYEAVITLTVFEMKKILIDKRNKSESYLAAPEHRVCFEGLKKSYNLDKIIFSTYGNVYSLKRSRKDKDEDPSARSDQGLKKRKTSEVAEPAKEKLDWENPKGSDYPFDLTKPLPLVKNGNRQKVPVDYFFNNDLKYLQGGISTMTYMTSLTKTKAAQYDLLGIEDMVPNIGVLLKSPMIDIHFEESYIGENNIRPSMGIHEACNPNMMYILQNVF
nr:hypothetical protein [Tanacetum cinerariifolium]